MGAEEYLRILREDIHSVIFATADKDGHPVTCAVDIMLSDEDSVYFLTARGKSFYERLCADPFISLTGLRGKDTMSSQSITIRGKVRETGGALLPKIFKKNPYMAEIYPTEASRSALTVFQIYEGSGEYFDLSCRPIYRESFSFGGARAAANEMDVTEECTGCGLCLPVCPQKCIDISARPVKIQQEHCLHCGKCAEICPQQAIARRKSCHSRNDCSI